MAAVITTHTFYNYPVGPEFLKRVIMTTVITARIYEYYDIRFRIL
jgi:hypothetical protein